jgi:hypothetical protein
VIRGDLHIVGPRPDEPELVAQYRPEWRQRHDVKPGISGLAQIHGDGFDLSGNHGLRSRLPAPLVALDEKIMLKTPGRGPRRRARGESQWIHGESQLPLTQDHQQPRPCRTVGHSLTLVSPSSDQLRGLCLN